MGLKSRYRGLAVRVAQYNFNYTADGKNVDDWQVVIYDLHVDPEESPHDFICLFTKADWRRMGGKLPPQEGHTVVRLKVVPYGN